MDHDGGTSTEIAVTTFNLQNLFDLITEPDEKEHRSTPGPFELEVKLRKLTLALERELGCPEILVAQEIDNATVLQEVGDRVNELCGTSYEAVSFPTSDRRSIEVGFLYDRSRVSLVESRQLSGIDVMRAFGSASPSPGREPIVGVFEHGSVRLAVMGVHLKSRGGVSPLAADRPAAEAMNEAQRVEQARVLRTYADGLLSADPEAVLIIAGDFNDYRYRSGSPEEEQTIRIIEEAAEPTLRLTDALDRIPPEERYTFIHYGAAQLLDHVFLSREADRRTSWVHIHHINAGFPRTHSLDPSTARRCSDHDPVEVRLHTAD